MLDLLFVNFVIFFPFFSEDIVHNRFMGSAIPILLLKHILDAFLRELGAPDLRDDFHGGVSGRSNVQEDEKIQLVRNFRWRI